MAELIRRFWSICLLRAGPQELPAAGVLLALAAAAYGVSGLVLSMMERPTPMGLGRVALDMAVVTLFTRLLLTLRRHPARLTQTLTALFGSGTVLNLVGIPLTMALVTTHAAGGDVGALALLALGLLAWSLLVSAHILRHALEIPFGAGFVLALGYMLLIINLTAALFPAELPTP